MPDALRVPPAPAGLAYLLAWFRELASARGAGFAEPLPLAWADIKALAELTQAHVAPWEARVLRLLDAAWLRAWRKGRAEAAPTSSGAGRTAKPPRR